MNFCCVSSIVCTSKPVPTFCSATVTFDNWMQTSAAAVGRLSSLPLKITSSMRSPRRLRALCSPKTQVIASITLLLPQPLGPTMAVTPSSNASSARSGKLLKPAISIWSNRINQNPTRQTKKAAPTGILDYPIYLSSGWKRSDSTPLQSR